MGTIKAIVGVLVIVGLIYSGFQIIPPEITNYSFADDLKTIALMSAANYRMTDQDIVDQVMKKAQEHEIALTPQQITVQRIGTAGMPATYVAADYSVPVSLPGYSFTMHFTPTSGTKGF